jgi:hypothetical protein
VPNEYNFRNIGPNFAGKGSRVKIIHGRTASFERLASRLNRSLNYRVFLTTPARALTSDLQTYKGVVEAASDYIFEHLPLSVQRFLSRLRRR